MVTKEDVTVGKVGNFINVDCWNDSLKKSTLLNLDTIWRIANTPDTLQIYTDDGTKYDKFYKTYYGDSSNYILLDEKSYKKVVNKYLNVID